MGEAMVDLEEQKMKRISHENKLLEANRPVTLKFEDVGYKVKLEKGTKSNPSKKTEEKIILKGITGIVHPREMLAMLGPSGSGKTTLLTALGGRLGGKLTGKITYNNEPFSSKIKRDTGFVTQDDVLYPTLTVTETLVYTSLLRLPNTFTKAEKKSHAEAVISQLGLTTCKDSIIGGPHLRGVSGGERKRVSIGQEMLINPSLILLDEPTSGLDSTTAQRIVSTLSELACGGRTIVMTIHQPSSRLFYMFHKILLLSEGNTLYFGKGAQVCMDYFSSVGYAPKVAMNPSDFLLDLANGVPPDDSQMDEAKIKQDLVTAFKCNLGESLKEAVLKESNSNLDQQGIIEGKKFARWTTTWWQQFTVLLKRGVKERKHETFSSLKIGQVLVVALLSGLLWWQSDISHLQDQMGLLFFSSGFWGFFPLFNAIFTFPQERMMLEKERSSGTYRLSSYFMARTMADAPMELVLPTVFLLITYWMGGLKPNPSNFFETLFVLLFSVLVSQGLGLAVGALVMDQKSATILGSVVMLSFLLVGGYYVQNVPRFIAWVKYVSINQYTYKLMVGAQYKGSDTYACDGNRTCLVGDFPAIRLVGLGDKAFSIFALGIMLVGYRVIAYIALMRIGVTKKKGDEASVFRLLRKKILLLFK